MTKNHCQLIQYLAQLLFDKKGSQITAFDVRGVSSITDYVLIANGNVERHVLALSEEIEMQLKQDHIPPSHIDGRTSGDWVVLDYFDFIIHLLVPSMRQKYELDRLWSDGKVIDVDLSCSLIETNQPHSKT